jgi:hypothetical protein
VRSRPQGSRPLRTDGPTDAMLAAGALDVAVGRIGEAVAA